MRKVFKAASEFIVDRDNRCLVLMMGGGVALTATVYVGTVAARLVFTP